MITGTNPYFWTLTDLRDEEFSFSTTQLANHSGHWVTLITKSVEIEPNCSYLIPDLSVNHQLVARKSEPTQEGQGEIGTLCNHMSFSPCRHQ